MVAGILTVGGAAKADFVFGKPTNLGPNVNSSSCEYGLSISSDGLSLFFDSDRPDLGDYDLYVSTRETTEDEWGPAVNLGPTVNSPTTHNEGCPSISADSLELFFSGQGWQFNPTGFGKSDLWVTRRATPNDPWSEPENLGPTVNTSSIECEPSISADGLSLYFCSDRSGWGFWVTTRKTKADPWQEPVSLGPKVNVGAVGAPSISADALVLFFASDRPGGYGKSDLWTTRRTTKDAPWEEPVNLGPGINTPGQDLVPCISVDGRTLYYSTGGLTPNYGWFDIWQAPIIPILDFNGDGKVDEKDLVLLINDWGTADSLCDVGPMPWGDGKVDAADLEVLMSYWGQEPYDPTLIAHWKLDETDGDVACDSSGSYDGTLCGGPVWEPAGGYVDGALCCDGVDDYVATPFVLDRIEGSFSVFAWVSGGAPGQVILSQKDEVNWLMADAATGALLTQLGSTGRQGQVLASQGLITEDTWHRVGFVRDGSDRILYVDDIEVARDTAASLKPSWGGLYIGAGKGLEPGTFWKGLIDDVRIYDQAVQP